MVARGEGSWRCRGYGVREVGGKWVKGGNGIYIR